MRSIWRVTISGFLFLCCLGGLLSSCKRADRPAARIDAPPDLSAVAGKPIAGGETHEYRIPAAPGQFARLLLQARGTDLQVSLRAANGQELATFPVRENEAASLSLPAAVRADASRLRIVSSEKKDLVGAYDLALPEQRPESPKDARLWQADLAFLAAESLRAENDAARSRRAIEKYDEAIREWHALGRSRDEALALKHKGSLEILLGRPHEALAAYQTALERCDSASDPRLRVEILSLQTQALVHVGSLPQSLEAAYRALYLSLDARDPRAEAQALNALNEAYYGYGDRWRALTCSKLAIKRWNEAHDRRGIAKTQIDIGFLFDDLGNSKLAGEFYAQAETLSASHHDPDGQAMALIARGGMHFNLGEHQTSMSLYEQARSIFQRAGNRRQEANAILNLGATHFRYADPQVALAHFEQARAILHEIGYPALEAGALSVIGDAYALRKEEEKALSYYRQAFDLSHSIHDTKYESNAVRKIGRMYRRQGKRKEALSQFKEALRLHRKNGEQLGAAQALGEMGQLHAELKQFAVARPRLEEALAIYRAIENPDGVRTMLFQLAQVEQELGRLARAQTYLEEAQKVAESLRASVASQKLRASYFASIQQQFEFQIDLLMRRHQQAPRAGFDAEAFRVSEARRSRSLLEMLVEARQNLRQGADATLISQEQELRKQIETLVDQRQALQNAQAPAAEIDALSAKIQSLINDREQIEAHMRAQNPRYAELTQTRPAGFADIRGLLDRETLLLEYSLGEKQSYLWALTSDKIVCHLLPGREEIEPVANEVRRLLATPPQSAKLTPAQWDAQYWPIAGALSDKLLGRVRGQLGQRRLLLVVDGALARIPFAALPVPQGTPGSAGTSRPLMLDHELLNQPSASTLLMLRQHRPTPGPLRANADRIAVFADAVYDRLDLRLRSVTPGAPAKMNFAATPPASPQPGDMRRLHWTHDEALAIEEACAPAAPRVLEGFSATREAMLDPGLKAFSILHFATHGVVDDKTPELSSLVFSRYDPLGRPQNGNVRLSDISGLDLDADLVVLSACQTGVGKEILGEGMIGLSRSFLYAGSSRVLASLWNVEDIATARLMKDFYWNLLKRGERPAAALQHAQMALWQTPAARPPFFWAAFVLQGEFQ